MMKKNLNKIYRMGIVIMLLTFCFSCDSYDEVVPLDDKATNTVLKLPDPTTLSTQESAEVDAIKQEYINNVNK